jgi:hypothetical protein
MPDEAVQTQVAEPQGVTEADIDKMSLEDLEKFTKGTETQAGNKPEGPVETPPGQPTVPEAAKPKDQANWIEVEVDDPTTGAKDKLRFRSQEDLLKSFSHAQRLIRQQKSTLNKYNAERGQAGDTGRLMQEANQRIASLEKTIQQLTQGAQQLQAGQSPTGATQNALSALMARPGVQGQPLEVVLNEINNLKSTQLEWQAKMERLEGLEKAFQAKEVEAEVNHGVQELYQEVNTFQQKHPEYLTDTDFAKLDDLVSTYGEDVAKTMMSEKDFTAYQGIMQVVGVYKHDPKGQFDLRRKNQSDLEESWLVHQHRTGAVAKALAAAKKEGIDTVEGVLSRQAQSATTLPNTKSNAGQPEMGPAEAEQILNLPVEKVMSNPDLQRQFRAACRSVGINPDLVLGPEVPKPGEAPTKA